MHLTSHDETAASSALPLRARAAPAPCGRVALAVVAALTAALWPRGLWPVRDEWTLSWAHVVLGVGWLVAVGLSRVAPRRLARRLIAPFVMLALGAGAMVVVRGWPAGLPAAAEALGRGGLSVATVMVLSCTIPANEILRAGLRLGLPRSLASALGGMLRYTSLLAAEQERMRRAREARRPETPWLLGRDGLRVEASLAGGLVVRALDRAERVHAAMLARGYDGKIDPWLYTFDAGVHDVA